MNGFNKGMRGRAAVVEVLMAVVVVVVGCWVDG